MNDYTDSEGRRVTVHKVEDGHTIFFPAGGGLEYRLPTPVFNLRFSPAPERAMRRGTVTAEFLVDDDGNEIVLPCWSDDAAWNGWGMPSFDRATVDKLIEFQTSQVSGALRWEGDNVVAVMGDDPEDTEVYEPTTAPDGTKVWPVGAGSWTWDSINFEAQPQGEKA